MKRNLRHLASLAIIVSNVGLCSCVQKMAKDGHLKPLDENSALSLISRQPPDGTVDVNGASHLDGVPEEQPRRGPTPLTAKLIRAGREKFDIFCMPCHGAGGYGDGVIVQRGFLAPPSYHDDRLRAAPDAHFYDVITRGYGAMYSYGDRVDPAGRWAIVAYIRALQLSQNARWSELPPQDRRRVLSEAGK